jgi:DNA-binding MurR/RpiR family transcriptional regulator
MQKPSTPTTIENFEERLVEISTGLPKRLKQCADYIAANKDRIAVSTVAEIAKGAGVQPSAIMRFCQLFGFSGFSEMQRLFRDSYTSGWPDYTTRLDHLRQTGGGSPSGLLAEFVDAGRTSLESLLKTIDLNLLDKAVDVLTGADLVHIVGLRRSFAAATYLAYAFEKMGVPAVLHSGTGALGGQHSLRKGDALVAITFAPYTQDTIDLAREAHEKGVSVIAITDTMVSPLRKSEAVMLTVSEVDFGAFRTLSATFSLAITLAVAVGTAKSAQK